MDIKISWKSVMLGMLLAAVLIIVMGTCTSSPEAAETKAPLPPPVPTATAMTVVVADDIEAVMAILEEVETITPVLEDDLPNLRFQQALKSITASKTRIDAVYTDDTVAEFKDLALLFCDYLILSTEAAAADDFETALTYMDDANTTLALMTLWLENF